MRTNKYSRKKKLLALCLTALMASTALVGLASCKDDEESSSSTNTPSTETTESAPKDTGLVTNASFETFNKNKGLNLIGTSVTGWSRSVNSESSGSALSSKSASGVIDVSDEAWANLTTSKVDGAASLSDEEAENKWDEMSALDKITFIEAWKKREDNKDKEISDLSFYQSFNIDSEDIPDCDNPLTWDYGSESSEKDNNNVLMIRNEYSTTSSSTTTPSYNKMGTAQKFTSSSTVTVVAGTSAKFSVWVKTSDLQSTWTDGSAQSAVNKGAYISISHSVGNKTYDPLIIKNINTEITNPRPTDSNGLWVNNGWEKYEFVLNGSTYADTTFSIVLGLGQGGGTNRNEYVNGYAFFDDITCEKISNEAYQTEIGKGIYKSVSVNDDKTFVANKTDRNFALSFHKAFTDIDLITGTQGKPTTEEKNGKLYTAANGVAGAQVYTGLGFDTDKDKAQVYAKPADMNGSGNEYLQSVYDNYFKNESDFLKGFAGKVNEPVLMLLSAKGAAYTAEAPANSIFSMQSDENNNSYLAISFFVKTSDMHGVTGAGVTVTDLSAKPANAKTSIFSIDTTDGATVDIDDENKDVYDGWQKCFVFVSNETGEDINFSLSFTLGSTAVVDTKKSNYESGFAAFTGFSYTTLSEEEFASAKSGTYSTIVNLKGEEEEKTGDSGFDTPATVPSNAIEKGFANLKNYKGVYADSAYLGNANGSLELNQNKNAGLLSKDYLKNEDETENANYTQVLTQLGATGATNEARWNSLFYDNKTGLNATRPLVIYNATSDAYGFLGQANSLSEKQYATVSVRVKVSAGAKAYIYLTDTDSLTKDVLSIGRTTSYWYDDDGNVCSKDPAASDFNKKRDVAFKLQPNGLYKLNKTWTGAEGIDAEAYFANLSAYTEKDADGNLLVAENGVSYDYNDNWRNEGNDGVAFYHKDGKFYADENHSVLVNDFASVAALAPRYAANENKTLFTKVENTNGGWVTVTFYLRGGADMKSYRLEVWSGARDGSDVSATGSYVLFDSCKPEDASDSNFQTLLNENKEGLTEDTDYFKSVYSFYDDSKFLRYNATADENDVGNSYENYLSSSQTEGIAYLYNETDETRTVFADYSLTSATVSPDDADDDSTDDTEEEEEEDTNVWLLVSSIAIAAVLVLAVLSMILRKLWAKRRKKRGYSAKSKDAKKEAKKEKKAKKAKKSKKSDK